MLKKKTLKQYINTFISGIASAERKQYPCCFPLNIQGNLFEPVLDFGGEEQFKNIKNKDKIREDFCKENNITLIRIDARNWLPYKVIS